MATDDTLLTRIATIDEVLDEHATVLRGDFVGYRNHVYRIVNLCVAIAGRREIEKIAVAAVFHDLGIWTNATWPSAGFHWRLVTLTLDRVRHHPLSPLPMVRL